MSNTDMGFLDLLKYLESSQWKFKQIQPKDVPIMTRSDLQKLVMKKGLYEGRSSGATGEPVIVQKNALTHLWWKATNLRELIWRKWDPKLSIAVCTANVTEEKVSPNWGEQYSSFGETGKIFMHPLDGDIQEWLERVRPSYLQCYPSVINTLNLIKIPSIIDIKSTGETGGTTYSCSEAGTIAIQCPKNSDVMHVMENIILEIIDGQVIISDRTNSNITRYAIGDYAEWGECSCGRTLQTIKSIVGRERNMVLMPDGTRKWPKVGSLFFREKFPIERFQVVQVGEKDIEIYIVSRKLIWEESMELIWLMRKSLGYPFNIKIKYVDSFPLGKFEEFKNLYAGVAQ